MSDLEQESALIANAFGPAGKVLKPFSLELPFAAELNLTDVDPIKRRLSSEEFIDPSNNEKRWLVEYHPESRDMKLICVKKLTSEYELGGALSKFLACVSRATNKDVLFHALSLESEDRERIVRLVPTAVVRGLSEAALVDLMQKSFVKSISSNGRRWPVLIGAIMAKMAEDGFLREVSPSEEVKRVVGVEGRTRPVVKVWVLVVVPLLLVFLFGISVGTDRLASQLFPYGGPVGEDNMIRIWAGEKRRELRSDAQEPSWLALVDSGNGKRLTANIDEPGSLVYDKKVRIRGVK